MSLNGLVIIATTVASVPVHCSEQAISNSHFDYGTTVSDKLTGKCPIVRQGALHIKRYGQLDGRTGPAGPWYPPGDSAHTADARDALGPQARCTLLETSRTCSTRILPIGGGRTVKVAHTKGPTAIVWTTSSAHATQLEPLLNCSELRNRWHELGGSNRTRAADGQRLRVTREKPHTGLLERC